METCRLCLLAAGNISVSIEKNDLRWTLEQLFNITFAMEETLPVQICVQCYCQVQTFSSYWDRVRQNQTHLYTESPIDGQGKPKVELIAQNARNDTVKNSPPNADVNPKEGNDERPHKCVKCALCFTTQAGMSRHMTMRHGKRFTGRLRCTLCGVWFSGANTLCHHMRHIHPKTQETFPCDICNQRYRNKKALQQHRKVVHTDAQYSCEYCGKQFKRNAGMLEHRATHTGESLYQCDMCGETTKSRAGMSRHRRTHHPEQYEKEMRRLTKRLTPTA